MGVERGLAYASTSIEEARADTRAHERTLARVRRERSSAQDAQARIEATLTTTQRALEDAQARILSLEEANADLLHQNEMVANSLTATQRSLSSVTEELEDFEAGYEVASVPSGRKRPRTRKKRRTDDEANTPVDHPALPAAASASAPAAPAPISNPAPVPVATADVMNIGGLWSSVTSNPPVTHTGAPLAAQRGAAPTRGVAVTGRRPAARMQRIFPVRWAQSQVAPVLAATMPGITATVGWDMFVPNSHEAVQAFIQAAQANPLAYERAQRLVHFAQTAAPETLDDLARYLQSLWTKGGQSGAFTWVRQELKSRPRAHVNATFASATTVQQPAAAPGGGTQQQDMQQPTMAAASHQQQPTATPSIQQQFEAAGWTTVSKKGKKKAVAAAVQDVEMTDATTASIGTTKPTQTGSSSDSTDLAPPNFKSSLDHWDHLQDWWYVPPCKPTSRSDGMGPLVAKPGRVNGATSG
ncbi:hypothetical protein BV25DRAFT_1922858, partial [Artomyces pyxidatus]